MRTIENPANLSDILFYDSSEPPSSIEPFVGPITVASGKHVAHGRGIVANREIAVGECLFVIAPTISANVDEVQVEWQEKSLDSLEVNLLESLTEKVLVKAMQNALQTNTTAASSFLALMGSQASNEATLSLDRLLGQDVSPLQETSSISDCNLLQIIRTNAFGPDSLVTYERVERQWKQQAQDGNSLSKPPRLLGLYPLAAMLNHSCVANAVRVFCGEIMIVHATTNIQAGEEILWSYLPPTKLFPERSAILQERGFTCHCQRCVTEQKAWNGEISRLLSKLDNISDLNHSSIDISSDNRKLRLAVKMVEEKILPNTAFSNELRYCIRTGLTSLYVNYLNMSLLHLPNDPVEAANKKSELLKLSAQLHFSFCACHNASTEHLSLLHLCYELARSQPDNAPSIKFWTEQLKRAHMIRYGNLGHDLETVRKVMQHSRAVLRNPNGMDNVGQKFI